ncbi:MAG: ATP-dependent RecD-like DNA helicase [Oscillospiraceae bacterium]|nr:ATP-dependent RecD-like DNA helicase [Oscillospiraceae bacterium]
MEQLRCVIERVTYQNEQNGYTVLRCRAKGFSDLVTVVGTMPEAHVGSVLSLEGEWQMNARFGRQFSVSRWEETLPATALGIEKYLGSGLVKGIGPKFARRIVRAFGADTLEIIETDPDRLLEVQGIGAVRVERIKKSWAEQKEIKNLMLFLQGHDVSASHATRIFRAYGDESIKTVTENPYRLADDIWGIGFKTADTIAQKLGFARDAYPRLRSGLLYTLNALADEGHCFALREQLLEAGTELLEAERGLLAEALDRMLAGEDLIPDGEAIYLPPYYHAEKGIARRLLDIASAPSPLRPDPEALPERVRARTGLDYDETQLSAIVTAARSKILVLTGGPGTGKTTTTKGILAAFREAGARILLAAPTGRAAKRLGEATGLEAKTVHRLLEYKPPEGYQRNPDAPLEGDVLVVDECSMIDTVLMYNLLKAVPDGMHLVLVGDIDQLPSVGAGNVLRDIIDSGCFPVVRLTRIFRQAQTSAIVMNAHRINQGKFPDLSNRRQGDFFFEEREDPEDAAETVAALVSTRLPRYYGVSPAEIQVLTPMQRGTAGAANLNALLQTALNPAGPALKRAGVEYRAGDKVMQIRNNYDKEVFNGDIGLVERADPEDRSLTVCFDGRSVEYDAGELDELALAYAVTIHKSQGSEYPIVVMPVLMQHYVMLQRNLIYTGITRAKRVIVLVGTKKAVACAVRNVTARRRNTALARRIRENAKT